MAKFRSKSKRWWVSDYALQGNWLRCYSCKKGYDIKKMNPTKDGYECQKCFNPQSPDEF